MYTHAHTHTQRERDRERQRERKRTRSDARALRAVDHADDADAIDIIDDDVTFEVCMCVCICVCMHMCDRQTDRQTDSKPNLLRPDAQLHLCRGQTNPDPLLVLCVGSRPRCCMRLRRKSCCHSCYQSHYPVVDTSSKFRFLMFRCRCGTMRRCLVQ